MELQLQNKNKSWTTLNKQVNLVGIRQLQQLENGCINQIGIRQFHLEFNR